MIKTITEPISNLLASLFFFLLKIAIKKAITNVKTVSVIMIK
ncbi:hypothetical protein ACKUCH_11460 [Flavobacterium psychrophilum]